MIALLLHHHQPDYRDPATKIPVMPWVRLHATRGYTDVATAIHRTGAAVTVNLVPSLLDQLDHYAAGGTDVHLDLSRRPAEALEPHEARFVADRFFHGHPALYGWFPAFAALRQRRAALSVQDLRDVQVWANLAWFGWAALERFPEIQELRRKGEGFSEAEKVHVLGLQRRLLDELRELHRGLPEVSASPYAHPILPLLVDSRHAARNLPHPDDPGFVAPEDAARQLREGRERVEAWIGAPVRGLWPSEGSVSPEVVELAAAAGFHWMATDEGVLERSGGGSIRDPWDFRGMRMVFRDHALSDRIGFVYQSWDGAAAARDLLQHARGGLLALDGENPWEGYPDAGRELMLRLFSSGEVHSVGQFAARPPRTLERLHTGSWIGADFRIWIGDPEDVAAWRLLARTRAAWVAAGRPEAAWPSLRSAEGSDWFWWYGPEFESDFADVFDRLFRAHLRAVWEVIGQAPPAELKSPLKRPRPRGRRPRAPLGERGWFAVAGAGHLELHSGAMAPGAGLPERLCWGRRGEGIGVWIEPALPGWALQSEAGRMELPAILPFSCEVVLLGPGGLRLPEAGAWTLDAPELARPED